MDVQKNKKKRIIYDYDLDGIPDFEPESPSEEEQKDNNKIEVKHKGKLKQKLMKNQKK